MYVQGPHTRPGPKEQRERGEAVLYTQPIAEALPVKVEEPRAGKEGDSFENIGAPLLPPPGHLGEANAS